MSPPDLTKLSDEELLNQLSAAERRAVRDSLTALKRRDSLSGTEYLKGLGRSVEQGALLGFGDELNAALRPGPTTIGAPSESFDAALERERNALARFSEENPVMSMTGEVVGSLPYAALPGAPAARLGPVRTLQRLKDALKSAPATGGALGATAGYGAAEGDPTDQALNTLKGATIGGAAGAAIPVIGKASGAVYDRTLGLIPGLSDAPAQGKQAILKAISRDFDANPSMALQELRNRLSRDRQITVPSRVADASPSLTNLAETAAQYPGKEPAALAEDLARRNRGARGRVINQLNWRMVPRGRGYFDDRERMTNELYGDDTAELYKVAYENNPSIMTPGLNRDLKKLENAGLFKDILSVARQKAALRGDQLGPTDEELTLAAREAAEVGKMAKPGRVISGFSLKTWDQIKRGIDSLLEEGRFQKPADKGGGLNSLGGDLWAVRKSIVKQLDDVAGDDWKAARAKFKGDAEVLEALDQGFKKGHSMAPEEVQKFLDDASEAEKVAFTVGYVRNLENPLRKTSQSQNAGQRIGEAEDTRQKISMLMPDDQQRNLLLTALDREAELFRNASGVIGNSKTMKRALGARDLEGGADTGDLAGELVGAAVNPTSPNIFGRVLKYLGTNLPMTEQRAGEVARILKAGTRDEVEAVLGELEREAGAVAQRALDERRVGERGANIIGASAGDEPERDYAEGGPVDWGNDIAVVELKEGGPARRPEAGPVRRRKLPEGRANLREQLNMLKKRSGG